MTDGRTVRRQDGRFLRVLVGFSCCISFLGSQGFAQDAQRALELERRDPNQAAGIYRAILVQHPADLPALMGLERSLTPLGRVPDMIEQLRAAMARDSSAGVLGVAIRVWSAARQPDSARAVVLRWARQEPRSDIPFQEWGIAAYGTRDFETSRAAYLLGRERLGPAAFSIELGRLGILTGDFESAAREWARAVASAPEARNAALGTMSQAPATGRQTLLAELGKAGPVGDRLAAALLIRWGEPLTAFRRIEGQPDAWEETLGELGRGGPQPETALARARLLELLGNRAVGGERGRYRLDAAQAYAEGGDPVSARRLLSLVARDTTSLAGATLAATSAIISVMVEEGGIEAADRRYRELLPQLSAEDRERLALRLAQGWLRGGRLGRADTLLAADSSVEAFALRGKLALYRGDLGSAREMLREAGPFAGDRISATQRIGVLGLLQVIDADSLPALGDGLLRLERGDSAGAVPVLEKVAAGLPPNRGGAELLFLAGQVQAGLKKHAEAERLLRAAITHNVPASTAAAEFALADLLLKQGRKTEAIAALEHLLLTWPTSAVVPQARRLLDVAKGAVPSSS